MKLPPLTIIPAGAGSGKTWTLQQQLGAWVADGQVAPERIVAVTFTNAAAAELKERIGAGLLGRGRVEDALRLEEAYVSTIHGFGLRILTEFAFEAGSSPQPRLLNEHEQNALIRIALARSSAADRISADLAAFGYRFDWNSQRPPEAVFRDDVLEVVGLLRSIDRDSTAMDCARPAAEWISARYGPVADAQVLGGALRQRIEALLAAFPQSLATLHPGVKAVTAALEQDYRNLRAALEGDALERDWNLWQQLRDLRVSKRGSALPPGYDSLAQAVMAAAAELPRHPGPLARAQQHITGLITAGREVLAWYEEAKRAGGLVDYGDMVALAARLLRRQPEVLATLVGRVDCLVVDEFQDTSPQQFALLWQLAAAGVPTVVVGDTKQAIMAFQGADPRLFETLEAKHPRQCRPLTKNWRSHPGIMALVNALGPRLFGAGYTALAAQQPATGSAPLELLAFPVKLARGKAAVRAAAAVGARLRALLADPAQTIVDRHTRERRRLKGSDLAVLCPTHAMLGSYAKVLRGLGLRVRREADGWFGSPVVQIACNALACLANPADRHAALFLAVTELGSLDLATGLRQLIDTGRVEEPLLARLDALAAGVADRTIYALVADTIAALGLWDEIAEWPDGDQERANLLRLLAEAAEFMEANRETLAHGGFHGAGVPTFLAWLQERVALQDGDRQPEARVLDEDAIVLCTWHSAKGREWPVVAVCGLDGAAGPRLPQLQFGYQSFTGFATLLQQARIEYAPEFAAQETCERFLEELAPVARQQARRLLYVALTRARDKLLLEWPQYLASTPGSYWSILADDGGLERDADGLRLGDQRFPCIVSEHGAALPVEPDPAAAVAPATLPVIGRRAILPGVAPAAATPDSRTPSASPVGAAGAVAGLVLEQYGEPPAIEVGLAGTALGSFLHRAFEVLGARPDLAAQLAPATGVAAGAGSAAPIAAAVAGFEHWLAARFPGATLRREWPLLHLDGAGTVVSGTADLLVETPAGTWIIDHKSDVVDDPVAAFALYRAQLAAYAAALAATGQAVAGVALHWIRRGQVVIAARGEPQP